MKNRKLQFKHDTIISKLIKKGLFILGIGFYLFFALSPIIVMILTSFKHKYDIQGIDTPIIPQNPTIENYIRMWRTIPLIWYIRNSLFVCGMTILVSLIISVPASYAMSRFRFRGKNSFSTLVLATQLFPGIIMLMPIFLMFTNITQITGIPMVKTFHGLIVSFATFGIPYSIWMMRSYFDSIPDELEQAAMIDGCSRLSALVRVVLPIVVPGMIATGLYVFLLAWNNVLFSGVLTDQETRLFATGIQEFASENSTEYGQLMAACTVTTIPIISIFLMFQKYFVGGLTGGAVKG
jgi:multiple sugar transport system permease protein